MFLILFIGGSPDLHQALRLSLISICVLYSCEFSYSYVALYYLLEQEHPNSGVLLLTVILVTRIIVY